MTGNSYWLFIGPAVVVIGLLVGLAMTQYARRNRNVRHDETVIPNRGPAVGGVLLGWDPGQHNASHSVGDPPEYLEDPPEEHRPPKEPGP